MWYVKRPLLSLKKERTCDVTRGKVLEILSTVPIHLLPYLKHPSHLFKENLLKANPQHKQGKSKQSLKKKKELGSQANQMENASPTFFFFLFFFAMGVEKVSSGLLLFKILATHRSVLPFFMASKVFHVINGKRRQSKGNPYHWAPSPFSPAPEPCSILFCGL